MNLNWIRYFYKYQVFISYIKKMISIVQLKFSCFAYILIALMLPAFKDGLTSTASAGKP